MKQYPKILVLSNECLSNNTSNGRTLRNFLVGWPKGRLAQFYIQSGVPDFDCCDQFFCVTDAQALNSLRGKKCAGGVVAAPQENTSSAGEKAHQAKIARNALTMLARNFVWQTGGWKNCGFTQWVRSFAPDIILLQAGDCGFMYRLATDLVKQCNAKLFIYNSEGYYFKNFDYFESRGLAKLFYPLFLADLRRAMNKAYRVAKHVVYICDELKAAYDEVFSGSSETIHTASELTKRTVTPNNTLCTISYCGNLGLDRHKSLMEIGQILQEISPNLRVDVYGKAPNEEVQSALENCPGVRFHGVVPYEQVKSVLYNSDVNLHVESFTPFFRKDLEFAFSTKIADSLSCGTCFLVHAPEELACSRYLKKHKSAYVISRREELKDVLKQLVCDSYSRERYVANALALAQKNHNREENVQKFQQALLRIM